MNETKSAVGTLAPPAAQDMDAMLVRRHLNGDSHAFEILFRKYQSPIFNLVSRMVNGEDAYDLTQDVFFNALRGLPKFRGDSKFSTWLFTIAKNVCLNRLRQSSYGSETSLDEMCEANPHREPSDEGMNVHRIVETYELQRTVNDVLAHLSPDQRLLITLRDFEQLSYEEISDVTGMSLQNVKSRLHRARIAFKNRFKPYLELLREG